MPKTTRTITRKQLYDKVWSTPMTAISKEYGLSDVGMAKLCKRHEIPRPPRGYWAKVEHGQKPPKEELPNPDQDANIEIHGHEVDNEMDSQVQAEVDAALEKLGPVAVREDLRGAHHLIGEMREYLNGRNVFSTGIFNITPDAPLDLKVSKTGLHRALRIMDALLKAMEAQGWTISTGPVVSVLGVDIPLSLSEGVVSKSEEPPEDDSGGRYQFHHSRMISKQVPSGEFTLVMGGKSSWYRRKVKDGVRQRLEDMLQKVLEGMVAIASSHRQDELAREERERQWAEEQRREEAIRERKARLKKKILAEKARVNALVREMRQWRQSQDLRAYIEARKRQHLAGRNPDAMDDDFSRWHQWALDQAARLDPLCPSPPSILDNATPDVMRASEDW